MIPRPGTNRPISTTSPGVRTLSVGLTSLVLGLALVSACGSSEPSDLSAFSPEAQRGAAIYTARGCQGCHGAEGSGGIGPAVAGIAGTERELIDGTVVIADTEYLRRSITDPNAEIVAGYSIRMPANTLSDSDVDALVAYIEELEAP